MAIIYLLIQILITIGLGKNMNFLIKGWLHHKNSIGIELMKANGFNFFKQNNESIDWLMYTDKFIETNFDKAIFGPHLFPGKHTRSKKASHLYNSLSPINKKLCEELAPELNCVPLPFPVDVNKFIPKKKNGKPVLYFKNRERKILEDFLSCNFDSFLIFDYNRKYREQDFLQAVSSAPYAVWIGRHESQGFAFQETLSCNTPIFCINVKSTREETGNTIWKKMDRNLKLPASSATYFSEKCGLLSNLQSFKDDWSVFHRNIKNYSSREFIVQELSSEACCDKWLKILSKF